MYQLLDLRNCSHDIWSGPQTRFAFLDTEDAAIAAITGNGSLIYHNRAFLQKNKGDYTGAKNPNIREVFPQLWNQFRNPCEANTLKNLKIVNMRSNSGGKPFGHLLVSFDEKKRRIPIKNLYNIISEKNHSDFINSYVGLYIADPDAYTTKVNPSYEKIAFLPETDLIGRNLRELEEKGYFSQSVTLRVLNKLHQKCARTVTIFQKIITGKDVLVTGTPIFSECGILSHVVTFVQDVIPIEIIARKCMKNENKLNIFSARTNLNNTYKSKNNINTQNDSIPKFESLPIIVKDPVSISMLEQILCAAKYDLPILLTGETGVGKDLMAQYIHLLRAEKNNKSFVAVNCSAIPGELLESELFGYEEGAFSGARKGGKSGLFEEADQGTLFLNEISEMPLPLQAKLLSALDEGIIRPLGSSRPKRIRTRIICATNKDLFHCVAQGSFRSDLYYRIKVLTIHLPPLRERPQDILPLIFLFMNRLSMEYGIKKFLSPELQDILLDYNWPGNVRELRNSVEQAFVFSTTNNISVCDLPPEVIDSASKIGNKINGEDKNNMTLKESVRQYERNVIEKKLAKCGKVSDAAKLLGIDPTTLTRKLKKS
jgi:transcriptional regulator with PAS, ATPase and Fis domain